MEQLSENLQRTQKNLELRIVFTAAFAVQPIRVPLNTSGDMIELSTTTIPVIESAEASVG